jgi:chromosome segregation ATPase
MAEKISQVLQIRTNEELVAKFKQISEELEVPYGSALELLLQSYDIGQLKAIVPDRAKEIEEVEILTRRFLEVYQNSIQLNKTAEDAIREGFVKQLAARDELIEKLKVDIDEAKATKTAAVSARQEMEREVISLRESSATEKDLLQNYKEKVESLSGLLAEYQSFKDENINLKNEIAVVRTTCDKYAKEIDQYKQEMERVKEQHQIELEKLENKHNAMVNELKADYQEKIYEVREDYNNRLIEQISKMSNK